MYCKIFKLIDLQFQENKSFHLQVHLKICFEFAKVSICFLIDLLTNCNVFLDVSSFKLFGNDESLNFLVTIHDSSGSDRRRSCDSRSTLQSDATFYRTFQPVSILEKFWTLSSRIEIIFLIELFKTALFSSNNRRFGKLS